MTTIESPSDEEYEQSSSRRPAILNEILEEFDEEARKKHLNQSRENLPQQIMDALANVRLQESILDQKQIAYDNAPDDMTQEEEDLRRKSIEQAKLFLEDRYQGAVALSEEYRRVTEALEEMKKAGLAPMGNREQRRSKRR